MKHENRQAIVFQVLLVITLLAGFLVITFPQMRGSYQSHAHATRIRQLNAARKDLADAVRSNDLQLARRSLANGADANSALLSKAIVNGQVSIVQLFLESGVDPSLVDKDADRFSSSPTASGLPVHVAVSCKQPLTIRKKIIDDLIQYGANPARENRHVTAMDIAVSRNDPQIADVLQEYGLPYGPREMVAFGRLKELKQAVKSNPEVVRQRFGNIAAVVDKRTSTLLEMALRNGDADTTIFLIQNNSPLISGDVPLIHIASQSGNPDLIARLVKHGVDVNEKDSNEDTALMNHAWNGPPDIVSALIQSGANVNARQKSGTTALHLAITYEQVEIARILLQAGADPEIPANDGTTSLDLARRNSPAILQLLTQ